jgi:hypothetical protein
VIWPSFAACYTGLVIATFACKKKKKKKNCFTDKHATVLGRLGMLQVWLGHFHAETMTDRGCQRIDA